jgi:hypothetical protein
MTKRLASALFAVAASTIVTAPALADEGMWTFDNFPTAKVNAAYGTRIDQAWLDRVRNASVRLTTGCSASLVSPEGLVLTNHHCVVGCVQDLSSTGNDYVAKGWLTRARTQEKQCPGMQAEILTAITDVTSRVNAAAAGKTGEAFVKARDAETARIEQEGCGSDAASRCQVVSLYRGGQFKLYRYRKYADVRLAFAPEFQAAFFGGDPDNFSFPRYALDAAFVRLYENGKPIASPGHLRWNAAAPKDGEPVFVSGNPGSTNRLQTTAQLETLRDLVIPHQQLQRSELRGRLIRFGQESAENKRIVTDPLFGVENSFKNFYGRMRALADPAFFERKRRAEAEVQQRIASRRGQIAGDPWREIAEVQDDYAELYLPFTYVEGGGGGSSLYGYARTLVRGAQERAKPAGERLPEFSESRLALIEKNLLDPRPVEPELEELYLSFWLSKAREFLTADDPDTRPAAGARQPRKPGRPSRDRHPPGRSGRALPVVEGRTGRRPGQPGSHDPIRPAHRRPGPRTPAGLGAARHRPDRPRGRADRQGAVPRLRRRRLSRRDLHAQAQLRQDRRLDRAGPQHRALHLHQGPVRPRHGPGALRTRAHVGRRPDPRERRHRLQPDLDQRHHRRELGLAPDQRTRRGHRRGVRRQPAFAGRRVRLRRRRQPDGDRVDGRHHRGAADGVRSASTRRRVDGRATSRAMTQASGRGRAALSGALLLLATASPAAAGEGMWTFDGFPAQRVNRELGTAVDQAWLNRVQAGAVRLAGGCSASLVSPEGLVLTNQHCVRSCVQTFSTPENDVLATGFSTRSREEERACPGQQAEVLLAIEDVTARVTAAGRGRTGQAFVQARDAAIGAIEKTSCGDDTTLRCQVVTLHPGRAVQAPPLPQVFGRALVWTPEHQAVVFGGDPDNFNFPRYALDAAFLRVYEGGRPAATPSHCAGAPARPARASPCSWSATRAQPPGSRPSPSSRPSVIISCQAPSGGFRNSAAG